MNDASENELIDDPRDPMARALRDQAPAARLTPSPHLRQRTLAALHQSPDKSRSLRFHRSPLMTMLATAAVIALAVVIYVSVRPQSPVTIASGNSGQAPGPSTRGDRPDLRPPRTFVAETTVRLAAFTQPLEQEAQALKSDLKRAADRIRDALPKVDRREVPK